MCSRETNACAHKKIFTGVCTATSFFIVRNWPTQVSGQRVAQPYNGILLSSKKTKQTKKQQLWYAQHWWISKTSLRSKGYSKENPMYLMIQLRWNSGKGKTKLQWQRVDWWWPGLGRRGREGWPEGADKNFLRWWKHFQSGLLWLCGTFTSTFVCTLKMVAYYYTSKKWFLKESWNTVNCPPSPAAGSGPHEQTGSGQTWGWATGRRPAGNTSVCKTALRFTKTTHVLRACSPRMLAPAAAGLTKGQQPGARGLFSSLSSLESRTVTWLSSEFFVNTLVASLLLPHVPPRVLGRISLSLSGSHSVARGPSAGPWAAQRLELPLTLEPSVFSFKGAPGKQWVE